MLCIGKPKYYYKKKIVLFCFFCFAIWGNICITFSLWAHFPSTEARWDVFRRTGPLRPYLLWHWKTEDAHTLVGWFWCGQTNQPELLEVETRHAGFLQQNILIQVLLLEHIFLTFLWRVKDLLWGQSRWWELWAASLKAVNKMWTKRGRSATESTHHLMRSRCESFIPVFLKNICFSHSSDIIFQHPVPLQVRRE